MEQTKLGDIVSFMTGKLNSNAAKPDGEFPFFTCSQETFKTDTYSFDTECVLLGGNNANGIYPLKYYSGKFDAYQRTYVIRSLDNKKLINRYLFYALHPKLDLLKSISTGAATKFLTITILKALEIEIPSIKEQHKIASILSAYGDLIENNNRRIKILEEMAQAIYREWFVNFRFPGHKKVRMIKSKMGMIPEGWEVRKVGGLADFMKGRKAKNICENAIAEAIPYLLIDGLRNRSFSYTDDPKMVIATNNDVIMVMDGASSGQVFIGYSGAVGSTLGIYRVRDSFCCSPYLLYLFMKENFKSISDRNVGSAIPHANKDYIASMSIAISSPEVMSSFQNLANSVFKQVDILERKNRNLRKTRDLLLPKLIRGEIDVEEMDIKAVNEVTV